MRYLLKIMLVVQMLILPSLLASEVWEGYVNITKDYIVGNGETLVIMPGTVVRVGSGFRIIVDGGKLIAVGEDKAKIRFTSYEPEFSGKDFWGGIDFLKADSDTSRFEHCIIENIKRTDGKGSIFMQNSIVNVTRSLIHNNFSFNGGAVHVDNTALNLKYSTILKNTALYSGGGIYVSNESGSSLAHTFIYKNLIKENSVIEAGNENSGGGGISIYEYKENKSFVTIQENDIVANLTENKSNPAGTGGGILIITAPSYTIDLTGNKIMYNKALSGGGVTVIHNLIGKISQHSFTNNIISNNTAWTVSGGLYYNTYKITNPADITFRNNNIVNNFNKSTKSGAGGIYIAHNENFFQIRNSVIWNNIRDINPMDIVTDPSVNPALIVSYSNTTNLIEQGKTNISAVSLFQRTVDFVGADPYENYLRGDYHLSLESPCIDKGDPETGAEWDGSPPNIGAYGLTNEATTSKYDTIVVTKPLETVNVLKGQTLKIDCRDYKETVTITSLVIEDGGQVFVASKPYDPNIYIDRLETFGKKIGDLYTTRIQRMATAEGGETPYNVLHVKEINCTGARFSNMSVNVNSSTLSKIIDSHIYVYDYNPELIGIKMDSPNTDIMDNVIDNFGIGIYYGGLGKADRKGRISNNTISFSAEGVSKIKNSSAAKGIVSENAQADISNNEIVNPTEGIEVKASSGRISNNTVSFSAEGVSKSGALKKAVHLYQGSNYEVNNNRIYCNDGITASVAGISVHNSFINAHYNTISFSSGYTEKDFRYGFFTENLSDGSIFINNTVYNSNYGIDNYNTVKEINLTNNIFFGPSIQTNIVSNSKNLVLFNNNIVGYINPGSVAYAENNISYDPLFQSTKVSDFYLWNESKCINTGKYDPVYHIYGENFYGSAPDIGAVEFWQRSSFYAPQNVSFSITSTTVSISWSPVPDAVSYNIYRSENPYSDFRSIAGTTSTSWSGSTSGSAKYFYYVTASRDGVKDIFSDNSDGNHNENSENVVKRKKFEIKRVHKQSK